MIVGPDWVWLHFPKCGGTTAETLLETNFCNDADVAFDKIDFNNVIWHENVPMREKRSGDPHLRNKRVVAIIRRLPDWILSRVHFEASRPPHHVVSREMLVNGRFFENSGYESSAEATVKFYNTPEVHSWIRLETMHQDFEAFFGRSLTPVAKNLNVNRFGYIRDRSFWFTKAELSALYAAAPTWAAIEEKVYGNLLV